MARNFNTNDIITFPVPSALIGVDGGPLTVVTVVKLNASAYHCPIYSKTSGGTNAWSMEFDTTGGLHANYVTGTTNRNVGTVSTGAYFVAIFRKDAGGTFQPVGRFLTGTNFATDSGNNTATNTLIDGSALDSGGTLQFGRWGTSDYSNDMDVAAVAVWNSYVADGTVTTFTTWANITSNSPTYWAKFEGSTVTDSASQTPTITNTTTASDPSGFFGAADQNVAVNGIASGESVGNSTLSATYTINANGAPSNAAVGAPVVTATASINANGVVSSERAGSPIISATATINANGISSNEALGTPTVEQYVTPSGIYTNEQFGSTSVEYIVSANGIATNELLGSPNLNLSVTPSGINTVEQFGSPTIGFIIDVGGVVSAEAFGTTNIHQSVDPSGISSSEQFGATEVQPGAVTVNAHGVFSEAQLGSPIAILAQIVNANAIDSLAALGVPTVNVGDVVVNAAGIGTSEAVGDAQLGLSVTPSGIPSNQSVGLPAITVADAGISGGNIASGEQFGSPTITTSATIDAQGIRSEASLGNAVLYLQLLTHGIESGEKFGSPVVSAGDATVHAGGIVSLLALGTPIITAPMPTPNTLLRMRIGQTLLMEDIAQSNIRISESETILTI